MDFAHYQSPKLLGFSPPITQVSIFGTLSISGQINRENLSLTCGDYPVYLGRSAKSKIPDRLGFSRHTKTRFKVEATASTDQHPFQPPDPGRFSELCRTVSLRHVCSTWCYAHQFLRRLPRGF